MGLAAFGGTALGLAGLPAGWLSGAILAVSIAALAGRPVFVPDPFAKVVFVLLGVTLGAAVTPETIATMASWPLSLVALVFAMTAITAASAGYLRVVHGWDRVSALLGAAPGALGQALLLADEAGVNVRAVAMVQTVRLFVLIIALPALFALFGASGVLPTRTMTGSLPRLLAEGAILLAACAAAAAFAFRYRLPGGLIVGSMIASGILHAAPRGLLQRGDAMRARTRSRRRAGRGGRGPPRARLQQGSCRLFELSRETSGAGWRAARARCSTCVRTRCDRRLDQRRRRRTADPARARALRRGAGRARSTTRFASPCAARSRLRPPGHPLRERRHRSVAAADGPAGAPEGGLRHHGFARDAP